MKPVKDRQFLNITYLSSLFGATAATAMFETVIATLTSMYASLKLHKLDFNIEVLNLFWLLLLYVLCVPSIIFTHFFILNWIVNLVHCLTIFFFFIVFHYYITTLILIHHWFPVFLWKVYISSEHWREQNIFCSFTTPQVFCQNSVLWGL